MSCSIKKVMLASGCAVCPLTAFPLQKGQAFQALQNIQALDNAYEKDVATKLLSSVKRIGSQPSLAIQLPHWAVAWRYELYPVRLYLYYALFCGRR